MLSLIMTILIPSLRPKKTGVSSSKSYFEYKNCVKDSSHLNHQINAEISPRKTKFGWEGRRETLSNQNELGYRVPFCYN
jgi:hypothetical protein